MWHGGSRVGITRTSKNSQILVGGCGTKQGKVRTRSLNRLRRKTVQQVRSSVESLSPITPRKGSLDKQSADDIINGTNDTFSFTILRGRVRTLTSGAVCRSTGGRSG
jgi:hypothetical protein